jgi:glyoxylase-like metal-dependent hydrolase (beta-lactamase superfamily II)
MKHLNANRREVIFGAAAAAAFSFLPARARASGAFSFAEGDFQVTVLSDGFISVPDEIVVPDVSAEQRKRILTGLDTKEGFVESKANIPVIRRGSDLILVDIGSGDKYQSSDGKLAANLKSAGIDPLAVTKVVFTHAHPDHIWATLSDDGSLRFPNAAYYVGAMEWNFWMDPDYLTTMPAVLHGFAKGARRDLSAVKERIVMLKPGDEVVTGLRALDTAGHTPGHLSLELAGREGLLITADVATHEIISFEHPEWKFGYDTIPDLAIKNRIRFIDRAATEKRKLLGYHWAYPGVGYAERSGTAYRFVSAS